MKFTRDEIRRSMLLYAISDRTWLKEGRRSHAAAERRFLPCENDTTRRTAAG